MADETTFSRLLRVFVLADVMVMGGLMMMMRGSVVMSGSLMRHQFSKTGWEE